MTRNFKSDSQIPVSWDSANNIQDPAHSLQITPHNSPNNMNPSTANGENQTMSNPWEYHGNKGNNSTFSNSVFSNVTTEFNSSAFSRTDNSVTNLLSNNLADLNIRDDRPRPTKIRRRNALTILDQHFPSTMANGTASILEPPKSAFDAFQGASLLQSLNEQSSEQSHGTTSFESQQLKRKVPIASNALSKNGMSKYHMQKLQQRRQRKLQEKVNGLKEDDISEISLHDDLNNFKPRGHDILPEKIFQELKDTQSERTMTSSNTCSALIIYRSPEALLFDINRRSSLECIKGERQRKNGEPMESSIRKEFSFDATSEATEPCIEVEMSD